MIIFAEVLEHLYTSPKFIFEFLYSILNKNGVLILQTPNAVAIHKRLILLLGKNPYMLISEQKNDPGHYREYTKGELVKYARNSGFLINKIGFRNYFDYQYSFIRKRQGKKKPILKIVNIFYALLPGSLKPGITMVLSKK